MAVSYSVLTVDCAVFIPCLRYTSTTQENFQSTQTLLSDKKESECFYHNIEHKSTDDVQYLNRIAVIFLSKTL